MDTPFSDLNFNRQIKACDEVEAELRRFLENPDIDWLREEMQSLGRSDWLIWFYRHAGAVDDFLSTQPSLKFRLPEYKNRRVRKWFVLAAIQRTRRAKFLLRQIDRQNLFPWAGGSGRDFAARAARAYDELDGYEDESLWPFPGPDPFAPS